MIKQEMYAKETTVFPADNGFVVKIGCQTLVFEGTAAEFSVDLGKYLGCDTEMIKEYTKQVVGEAFIIKAHQSQPQDQPQAEKDALSITSPAYKLFESQGRIQMLETKYSCSNGTITLDFVNGTAKVTRTLV